MNLSLGAMLLAVFVAGSVGGLINAILTDNGFILPRSETVDDKTVIFRPGYIGNVLIGGIAAAISWGLYSAAGSFILFGPGSEASAGSGAGAGLSLAAFVGAILVGVTGARWLTNEVDKKLLKAAASQAAGSTPSPVASRQIAMASPASALQIAKSMRQVVAPVE
jgi:hypothetical protein